MLLSFLSGGCSSDPWCTVDVGLLEQEGKKLSVEVEQKSNCALPGVKEGRRTVSSLRTLVLCLLFCRYHVFFLHNYAYDSERELEFPSEMWMLVCFFPLKFVLGLFKVNHGSLATLNWDTFKKSTLNFAIFCSGKR